MGALHAHTGGPAEKSEALGFGDLGFASAAGAARSATATSITGTIAITYRPPSSAVEPKGVLDTSFHLLRR